MRNSVISYDGYLPFVLLVGDSWDDDSWGGYGPTGALIPFANYLQGGWGRGSDHWYAIGDLQNDFTEDYAIGRLCVGQQTELNNIVNKIIAFETRPISSNYSNWKHAIAFHAGWENDNPIHAFHSWELEAHFYELINTINQCPFYTYKTYYQYWYNNSSIPDIVDESWQYDQGLYGGFYVFDNWVKHLFNGTDRPNVTDDPDGILMYFYCGHGCINDRLGCDYLSSADPYFEPPYNEGAHVDINRER